MRFAGIDIASETHVLAVVTVDGAVALKATPFTEDDLGYQKASTIDYDDRGKVTISGDAAPGTRQLQLRRTCAHERQLVRRGADERSWHGHHVQ